MGSRFKMGEGACEMIKEILKIKKCGVEIEIEFSTEIFGIGLILVPPAKGIVAHLLGLNVGIEILKKECK